LGDIGYAVAETVEINNFTAYFPVFNGGLRPGEPDIVRHFRTQFRRRHAQAEMGGDRRKNVAAMNVALTAGDEIEDRPDAESS